ncbi:MAG: ACP S-malonyltransferase [Saccharospirillum sp.]
MTEKQRALIVCPGRGTYNASEWGYLKQRHEGQNDWLSAFDQYRRDQQQPTLTELDSQTAFSMKVHSRGDHASPLIYACSFLDARAIDPDRFEIVAVTGNSMGWYTSLALAGALSPIDGLHLINQMGTLMHEQMIGGQLVYPWMDEQWRPDPQRRHHLLSTLDRLVAEGKGQLHVSIELGGMLVIGGDKAGLDALSQALPKKDRFPMALYNHAAFHTPLQAPVKQVARERLADLDMQKPQVPLIDGRGQIWTPFSTDTQALWDYTLGHQLTEPYHFTRAITVAVREYAPDVIIIPGPGTTLGGAVAQSLIQANWQSLDNKAAFIERQNRNPIVLAMGREDQRRTVIATQETGVGNTA